jgi:choline dehydrogenase-like flavoprotein
VKKAIVVGSGAGGAMAAKMLQGKFQVTVLEAGKEFRPLRGSLASYGRLKKAGLLFDERLIRLLFPAMDTMKTADRMIVVRGIGTGGTTTLAVGNALRMDRDLKALGIDLDTEFDEISREIPISADHRSRWRDASLRLYEACDAMGLSPAPLPKMGHPKKCRACGRCVLGCPYGIKWDSRGLLREATSRGADLKTGCRVERIVLSGGEAVGVEAKRGGRRFRFQADVIVLAAGGLGTPAILAETGISVEQRLFVDPVLCIAAPWKNARQNLEMPMPFAVQMDGYILSPYFDQLSYFFNRNWRPPAGDILSLMIKLADSERGSVSLRGIDKVLTAEDGARLGEATELCAEIFARLGISRERLFFGTLNAGHPGGMLPLGPKSARTLHDPALPENLYVADASLFPASLGNPPILTIMALAKRVSRIIAEKAA